jgi:hypothetical protein
MTDELLSSSEAAARLGIAAATFYGWLSQSDAGDFVIRGEAVTIHYFQGGRKGQGRIKIAAAEVDRLLAMMAVSPRPTPKRQSPRPKSSMQHITATPGRPDD